MICFLDIRRYKCIVIYDGVDFDVRLERAVYDQMFRLRFPRGGRRQVGGGAQQ